MTIVLGNHHCSQKQHDNAVIRPITEKEMEHMVLMKDPSLQPLWKRGFFKVFGTFLEPTHVSLLNLQTSQKTLNLIIYFICACTKLISTHKGRDRPGATIPRSFERGVIRTNYMTPVRPCKYSSVVASIGIMRFSASSKYSLANSAQHFCPF
jgi:hypothetical protein